MPDELIPGTKRTVAYKKPAAGKYIAPDNAMAANMAAQRNVMPNQSMGPFTMKYKNSSFPFKSSPDDKKKDDTFVRTSDNPSEGEIPTHVTSNKLDAIDTRLANLKKQQLENPSKVTGDQIKQGENARKKELTRVQSVRKG